MKKIWSKLLSCLVAVAMIFAMGANVMADPVDGESGTEVTEQQENKEPEDKQDEKKPEDQEKKEDPAAPQDDKESGEKEVAGTPDEEPEDQEKKEEKPKSEEPKAGDPPAAAAEEPANKSEDNVQGSADAEPKSVPADNDSSEPEAAAEPEAAPKRSAPIPGEGGDTPDPSIYYTFTLREGNWNAADIVYSTNDPECVASEPGEGSNKFYYSDGHWSFYLSDSCPFTAPDGYEFAGWDIANGFKNTIIIDIQEDMVATAQWSKINTDNSKAGDNITWKFNMNTGTLTLTGTGAMYDYNGTDTPWYSIREDIQRLVVSEGITVIGEYAFYECYSLYYVTLPDSLTTIKNSAFSDCNSLESIVIPAGVTAIGVDSDPEAWQFDAFHGCKHLDDIYLAANPANLTWKEDGDDFRSRNPKTVCHVRSEYLSGYNGGSFNNVNVIFQGDLCGPSMTWSFDEDSGELKLSGSGKMFDYADAASVPWSSVKTSITNLFIYGSDDITIGKNAFNGCVNLSITNLNYSGITSIGASAFEGCTSLMDANFPSNLTSIGSRAFYNSGIQWLTITKSINSIGSEAFKNCTSLLAVYLYCDRISIGKDAFYGCTGCYTIYIENNNLTAANIEWDENNCDDFIQGDSKAVLMVGPSRLQAFIGKFSGKVNVEFMEYQYCPPQGYPFGNGLTWRLDGDGILTISGSGDMPDFDYKQAPWSSFGDGDRITRVVIGDQITGIGKLSFYECRGIKSVTIPDSVTRIGYGAFMNCFALENVTIPGSVKIIDKYAFQSCEFTSVTICNGVESIGTDAFAYTKLRSVTVPDSVTYLGDGAFYCCSELKSAKLSKNLESIEEGTFNSCHKLYSVNIPDGVTSIGEDAFNGCSALSSANIPGSVKTIGDSAFMGCSHMKDLTIAYGVEKIGETAFSTCQSLTSITIPDSVTFIDRTAFNMCINATTITLPSGITAISDYTFYNCINLRSIVIPNKVKTIGEHAFTNCQKMESLIIPESVTTIGMDAFDNCLVLKTITILSKNIDIKFSAFNYCPRVTDVYCYADPANVEWDFSNGYVFNGNRIVPRTEENAKIHVPTEFLSAYHEKFDSKLPSYIEIVGGAQNVDMVLGTHLYGYSLSLAGDIGVNFYMELSDTLIASETAKMVFKVPSGNTTITETLNVKDVVSDNNNKVVADGVTYYKFKVGVAAKDISQNIKAQMVDGTTEGIIYTFSVKQYAEYLLDHESDFPNAAPLVSAMLNYGAFAQDYFKVNGTLVADESKLTGVTGSVLSGFNNASYNLPEGISFKYASLSLKSGTTLSLYFESSVGAFTLSIGDKTYDTETSGNLQVIRIRNIMAGDLENEFTVTVSASTGTGSMSYCPLKYCYLVVNDPDQDPALQNVCKALYLYYSAAKSYAN